MRHIHVNVNPTSRLNLNEEAHLVNKIRYALDLIKRALWYKYVRKFVNVQNKQRVLKDLIPDDPKSCIPFERVYCFKLTSFV